MEFYVRSDVIHTGVDECGTPIEGLSYYVVAESPNGWRLAHTWGFDNEPQAEKLCKRIKFAYAYGQRLNPDLWEVIDPDYGSEAYQMLDSQKYFRNREIDEAFEAGEINEHEALRLKSR